MLNLSVGDGGSSLWMVLRELGLLATSPLAAAVLVLIFFAVCYFLVRRETEPAVRASGDRGGTGSRARKFPRHAAWCAESRRAKRWHHPADEARVYVAF